EIARDDPMLGAVDLEVIDRREEAPGIDALLELGVVDRDVERRLAVAVDHARYPAGATLRSGGPLAGPRARHRLQLFDGRHDADPLATKRPLELRPIAVAVCLQGCLDRDLAVRPASRPAVGALIATVRGNYKERAMRQARDQKPRRCRRLWRSAG